MDYAGPPALNVADRAKRRRRSRNYGWCLYPARQPCGAGHGRLGATHTDACMCALDSQRRRSCRYPAVEMRSRLHPRGRAASARNLDAAAAASARIPLPIQIENTPCSRAVSFRAGAQCNLSGFARVLSIVLLPSPPMRSMLTASDMGCLLLIRSDVSDRSPRFRVLLSQVYFVFVFVFVFLRKNIGGESQGRQRCRRVPLRTCSCEWT